MLNVTVFKHGHRSQMHMHSGEIDEAVVNMNVWNDGDFPTYACLELRSLLYRKRYA